jgi:threonine aldolase
MTLVVDLRSDTVTRPTDSMREAMAKAEVGDDVFGEDPTVNELQEFAAQLFGRESSVFVPSGTMANTTSILALTGRGDEAICGSRCHVFRYEQASATVIAGVQLHTVAERPDGSMAIEEIEAAIRGDNDHFPTSRLVLLENTHNMMGGVPLPVDYVRDVATLAHSNGLLVHLDGARIFNAATAFGVDVAEFANDVDTISVCLSKALGAPAGSLVIGDEDVITRVRRARKMVGGGMRQSGILAAAGIVALRDMRARLADDHARADELARRLDSIAGIEVEPVPRRTNMVYFGVADHDDVSTPEQFIARLEELGVRVAPIAPGRFRAVLHHDVAEVDLEDVVQQVQTALVRG